MPDLTVLILAFLLGIVSGFIAALSSGGGLLAIPGVIFLGLSPSVAIATTRLDALSSDFTALLRYKKEKIIHRKHLLSLLMISVIGGIIGSKLLLQIDENSLEKVVGVLLLLLAPTLVFNKNFGLIQKLRSKRYETAGLFAVFFVMIYSAMIGAGGGIFLMYALIYFYGMSVVQANAHRALLGLFATAAALVTYISAGAVDFAIGIPLMLGAGIGGYLGAKTAIKKGNPFVRWALLGIILISSTKLLFL